MHRARLTPWSFPSFFTLIALAATLAGCGGDAVVAPKPDPKAGANAVPNFSLVDMNLNSTSYHQRVSPRQYLGKISGWYFGHAT